MSNRFNTTLDVYEFIPTITSSISSSYDIQTVADISSRIVQEELSFGADRSIDSIGFIGLLIYHEMLANETSHLHHIIRHHSAVCESLAKIKNPSKVLLYEIDIVIYNVARALAPSCQVDFLNTINFDYVERYYNLDTSSSRLITRQNIESGNIDSDYDFILMSLSAEAYDFSLIEKCYDNLAEGGLLVLSGSNEQGYFYVRKDGHFYFDVHKKICEFPNSNVFHLTESVSYTLVHKGAS